MASIYQRVKQFFSPGETPADKITRAQKISAIPPRDPALAWLLGLKDPSKVEGDGALNYGPYFCGVNLISSVFGMLPVAFYKKSKSGLAVDDKHIGTELLGYKPNSVQTPDVFFSTMQMWALTWGNAVAEIIRAGDTPTSLMPIHPELLKIEPHAKHGLIYKVSDPENKNKAPREIKPEDVIHIRNLSSDGMRGLSTTELARATLNLGMTSETFAQAFFQNGATMSGIITHPEDLGPDGAKSLQERIEKKHQGAVQAFNLLVLDEGMQFRETSIPPEAAQFLQTRQFSVIEIARWLNIPPVLLFDLTAGTFSNVEQLTLQFMTYTMGPWIRRWENELNLKLSGGMNVKAKFDRKDMQVIDIQTRYEAWSKGRNGGWLNLNNILEAENLPLLDENIGSSHLAPSTMKTLERTDFGNAVDMDSLNKVMAFFDSYGPTMPDSAKEIINAAIPNASDAFVLNILSILTRRGKVTAAADLSKAGK